MTDGLPDPRWGIHHEREVHTYAELWHASDCVLDKGLEEPAGSAWQFLSSIVLTAFTLEAYLNHAGSLSCPNWPDLEVLSVEKKLRHLALHLKIDVGAKGERPIQTVSKLLKIRNQLAHGKSEKLESQRAGLTREEYQKALENPPKTEWESVIGDPEFSKLARADVEDIIVRIHKGLPEGSDYVFSFGNGYISGSAS